MGHWQNACTNVFAVCHAITIAIAVLAMLFLISRIARGKPARGDINVKLVKQQIAVEWTIAYMQRQCGWTGSHRADGMGS